VTPSVARNSIEYGIITAIAASFSLGVALTETGAADQIARGISAAAGTDPYLALIALYIVTVIVTEMVTNAACAVVMFPIAISLSEQCNASLFPFVIVVMIAASAGFITPIGYQTHLMVYGPGGYKFSDFARFGAPMSVITGVVALYIIPRVWPF
jgi:di/tricarboxylate transporter